MSVSKKLGLSKWKHTNPKFSKAFQNALSAIPMVQQMVSEDQALSLDDLCLRFPKIVNIYCDAACDQLRERPAFQNER